MIHPWRDLRSRPHITVIWTDLGDRLGATDGHSTVWLDDQQLQVERRCTLAHELAHIDLGHTSGCSDRDEIQASRLAARRLIRLDQLADALVWSQHLDVVAEALWVDVPTLRARLDHLHPAERHYLRQRIEAAHP